MENLSYEALVELITKEVTRIVNENKSELSAMSAKPTALLAGKKEDLPVFAVEKFRFDDISAYEGDIEPYEALFISEISFAELADCALGRDSSKLPCAFIKALLSGKDVYLLEKGLPHKAYERKLENRNFYSLFETYVNSLRSFGVNIIKEQWHGKNLDRNAIEDNTVDKVITERLARELCEASADGYVKLRQGTVITPSAKDVFNHSEVKVEFVN